MTMPDADYYAALFRTVGFVLMTADESFVIHDWNDQACRVFGGRPEQMIGTPLLEVFPAEFRNDVAKLARRALDDGAIADVEFSDRPRAPDRRTFVAIFSPIVSADGRRLGVSVAMRNITERKRLSQQLSAQRRMMSLGHISAGVAHHFNNILGSMSTSIDAALASGSERLYKRTLELLADQISRAARITHQLLAFSKNEQAVAVGIDVNDALRRFVESLRARVEALQMDLVVDVEPVTRRQFDSHRLLPVLESLTQNGLDAMKAGGRLTVRCRQVGDEAEIVIEDNGCGMPPEVQERLFEPFFTTKGTLGGGDRDNVGLGLAAVHGMVEEMGGRIRVESSPGCGTRVVLSLPLREPTA